MTKNEMTVDQRLEQSENKLKSLNDYFSIVHDMNRPIKNELAVKAIMKIVKDAETPEMKCIKAICEEALYP